MAVVYSSLLHDVVVECEMAYTWGLGTSVADATSGTFCCAKVHMMPVCDLRRKSPYDAGLRPQAQKSTGRGRPADDKGHALVLCFARGGVIWMA